MCYQVHIGTVDGWLGEKEGKTEIQKSEYLENKRSFSDEIKNIFLSFWRTIIWLQTIIWSKIVDTRFKLYTTYAKVWNKRKLSKISEFSILNIGQNPKLGHFGNFLFSTCYLLVLVSVNSLLLLDLESQLRAEKA